MPSNLECSSSSLQLLQLKSNAPVLNCQISNCTGSVTLMGHTNAAQESPGPPRISPRSPLDAGEHELGEGATAPLQPPGSQKRGSIHQPGDSGVTPATAKRRLAETAASEQARQRGGEVHAALSCGDGSDLSTPGGTASGALPVPVDPDCTLI